jgi:hypothetical protein
VGTPLVLPDFPSGDNSAKICFEGEAGNPVDSSRTSAETLNDLRDLRDRLYTHRYITEKRNALREFCRVNYEQLRVEQQQEMKTLEAEILAFPAETIHEAECQRSVEQEEAKAYIAEHDRMDPREPTVLTVISLAERKQQRRTERGQLWETAKSLGIKRKQIAAEAFPNQLADRVIDTFKAWLSGKAYGDGSFRDRGFRRALAKLTRPAS